MGAYLVSGKVVAIARVCHAANRAWCEAHDDSSQRPWAEAEPWQRESAISGVLFALDHPNAPDSAQHENWMRDKIADGWVYGKIKDAAAKTHPCLVPFDQLPPVQQKKDRLFRAIVKALAG